MTIIFILFLFFFLIVKISGFFVRSFIGGMNEKVKNQGSSSSYSSKGGNHAQKASIKKPKDGYDGGEYIDYEEVD